MRWMRVLGGLGLAAFLASAFTPLPNLASRWAGAEPRVRPADAIVVLGGGTWPEGDLSDASLRRAIHGIRLYKKGLAPLILFLGPSREGPPEAEVRRALARELGVPEDRILTHAGVWTTREEALRARDLLLPREARRILLVTDPRHMVRARAVFERAGFEVWPALADDMSARPRMPDARLQQMRRVLQELFGRLYYRVAGHG
jgi:uncharacterized SAM-binding protein YcdF (DUF218 family)